MAATTATRSTSFAGLNARIDALAVEVEDGTAARTAIFIADGYRTVADVLTEADEYVADGEPGVAASMHAGIVLFLDGRGR